MTRTKESAYRNAAVSLQRRFREMRRRTASICRNLEVEDFVVQPIIDVSPPKWHLGHTTWFFETFLLQKYLPDYRLFHEDFSFVFNSYYEHAGKRVLRADRGNLTRPTVAEVLEYRAYTDEHMERLLQWMERGDAPPELAALVELGINHEEQHQELLVTDIKYILGHNPLFPAVEVLQQTEDTPPEDAAGWTSISEGIYEIGHTGEGFCFDNELDRHKVYLQDFRISNRLVSNGEFLEFMEAGGYRNFAHWLSDGWAWVKENRVEAPMYWYLIENQWHHYTFEGLQPVKPEEPLCHVSFYEADAFARWKGTRLPTEAEWEVASVHFDWGRRWEWTNSAYLPYPGFVAAPGAVGEYNGKFMINQMVLRGASEATVPGHSRPSYRNFFQPDKRWQYTGIRVICE